MDRCSELTWLPPSASPSRPGRRVLRRGSSVGFRRAVTDCPSFPWLDQEVTEALTYGQENGLSGVSLVIFALNMAYPVTPDGRPVLWPAVPGDCPALPALEARVRFRANLVDALRDDELAGDAWVAAGGY